MVFPKVVIVICSIVSLGADPLPPNKPSGAALPAVGHTPALVYAKASASDHTPAAEVVSKLSVGAVGLFVMMLPR